METSLCDFTNLLSWFKDYIDDMETFTVHICENLIPLKLIFPYYRDIYAVHEIFV